MIEFTSDNRPTCNPTNSEECKLNLAALQDVFDAFTCLYDKTISTGCYISKGTADPDDSGELIVSIDKEYVAEIPDECNIDVFVNGERAFPDGFITDDSDFIHTYSVDEDDTDIHVTIVAGSLPEPWTKINYVVKINTVTTIGELMNTCAETVNCRTES